MKELSIEEKAQRYDEALERYKAKQEYESQKVHEFIEYLFPELRESEDERIKNALIRFHKSTIDIDGIKGEDVIAWLEKQGEKESVTCPICGWEIEKQGGQNDSDVKDYNSIDPYFGKSTDKAEPKFHEGEWVVVNDGRIGRIVECTKDFADVDLEFSCLSTSLNNIRSWTIQDANAGDVLEFGDHGRLVVGIVSYVNKTTGKVDVSCLLEDNKFKIGIYFALDTIKPHPAAKEQRDTLMKAMADSGYTFDFEKKELKKIIDEKQIKKNLQDNSFRRMFEQKFTE